MREHHLCHCAGLCGLSRADESGPGVLICAEHPAGHLAVDIHHGFVVPLGRSQVVGVSGLLEVNRRAAEALGDVHDVPIGDSPGPVCGIAVDLRAQLEEEFLAGEVIEPVNTGEIVAGPLVLPEGQEEIGIGDGQLPAEVFAHQVKDAFIAGIFIVRLQYVEHDHIGPDVGFAADVRQVRTRAEVTIFPLAGYSCLEPLAGLFDDALITQDVSDIAEALEPVRDLFPGAVAFAFGAEPGVIVFFEEPADFEQVPCIAVSLKLELPADPALRPDGTDGQLYKGARRQRRTVGRVKIVC